MADLAKSLSAGGAATTSGTTFQEDVACYFAVQILAEALAEPPLGLPQGVFLTDVIAESAQPVDDLAVGTSVGGVLYIQSKTSLSLSEADDSELAKVLGQFIRQFNLGAKPQGERARPFDPVRDRLVLVISHDAPGTIGNDLQAVLGKLRTVTSAIRLKELLTVLNEAETRALRIILAHVQRLWTATNKVVASGDDELRLLHLIHILPLDLRTDGAQALRARDLIRTAILRDPTRAGDASRGLVSICRAFGPNRTGGDLAYLRSQLESMDVPLHSVPSFRGDIEALRKYTDDRLSYLKRLSEMELAKTHIKIKRPVVVGLQGFAVADHCAVIGEPGAGKSGCLHDVVGELREQKTDVVLLTADLVKASSPEDLARDLGLVPSHNLVDVLQNWSGDGLGYLVIDALDAARSGMSLHVLCEVLRDIRDRAPRWRIVASIREYDLRTSPAVQELFVGTPHDVFRDARFPRVRHICVRVLTDAEIGQVTAANPTIASALSSAPPALARLLRNPFNLSLLCKLLDQSVTQAELNDVQAQVGLLDLYWSRRVENSDATARTLVLGVAVNLMVEARELHISRLALARAVPANTGTVDVLLSDGLFAEVPGHGAAASSTLGFSHNILFDYATHRLWLDGLTDATIAKLAKSENDDLLLAIRASIVMAFEHLWYSENDRRSFWNRAIAFENMEGMRLIGKIIAAGVAAQEFQKPEDYLALFEQLQGRESAAAKILHFTIQAAITQHQGNPAGFPMIGQGASPWMALAVALCSYFPLTAWDVRSLLATVNRGNVPFTPDQEREANQAAIALMKLGLADAQHSAVVRPALEIAASTFTANAAATGAAIREVLTPDRVRLAGHEWLHPLAERIAVIANADAVLTLDIVDTVFSATGGRDEQVPMGGRLLPMTFNRHDMLAMARHDIDKAYPTILRQHPETAARLLLQVMKSTIASEHKDLNEPKHVFEFPFRGKTAKLKPDASHIWTAGEHNKHEDWWKVLDAFKKGLVAIADSGDEASVNRILDLMRDENVLAVVWNALLEAAVGAPSRLGPLMAELLASPAILGEIDTRKAAGDLIDCAFKHLSAEQRKSIETAILRLPDETIPEMREFAERRRDRMIGCIPPDLIQLEEIRRIRAVLEARGGPPPNEPDFAITTSWGGEDEHWWLRHQGVAPDKPANADLLRLSKSLKEVPKSNSSETLAASVATGHLPLLEEALDAVSAGKEHGADSPLIEQVEDEIIDACDHLASAKGLMRNDALVQFIRARLREGAMSPRPKHRAEDDEQWDRESAGWGSPSARIDAAMGLMRLAASPDIVDDEILQDIERLAADAVPAVRFQILAHLLMLYRTAPALMWRLIEQCSKSEQRAGILAHFLGNVLLRLPAIDHERAEPLIRVLYRRCRRNLKSGEVRRACTHFYLRAALWKGDQRAKRYVDVFAEVPFEFPVEASAIISACRDLMRYDESSEGSTENERVRLWAFSFLARVVDGLRANASPLRQRHAGIPFAQWPEDDIERLRTLHQLAHSVATEMYFASGAFGERKNHTPQENEAPPPSDSEKRRFLKEGTQLFDVLCDIEFVEAAYDVLQTLEYFIDVDERGVILRIASLVRRAQNDAIQYESMAADLVVRIVERYLAEYGSLFRDNAEARGALLDILDVFVGAGWPGATRLTYRLGEVFR